MSAVETFATVGTQDGAWRAFVSRHPQASIFHHPAWTDLLHEQYGFASQAACLHRAGELVAGLPYCVITSPLRTKRWISLPFSDHCVPLASDAAGQASLLAYVLRSAASSERRLEIRAPSMNVAGLTESTTHWLHTTVIDLHLDELFKTFHADTRRSIRKAQECGLSTEFRCDLEALASFYRLHTLTRRRLGVPVQPWNYFVVLQRQLLEKGLGFIALTKSGKDAVCAGLFSTFNRTICYKYGASTEARGLANYLMLWDAMQLAQTQGLTLFDFGKTANDNTGLRFFKRKWGSRETPLAYSYSPPISSRDMQDKNIITRMAGVVIRNSPPVVCRVAGETLYKHFAA